VSAQPSLAVQIAQVGLLLAGFLVVAASALAMDAFTTPIFRLLQGYWPRALHGAWDRRAARHAEAFLDAKQRRQALLDEGRRRLEAAGVPVGPRTNVVDGLTSSERAEYERLELCILRSPQRPNEFMPTRLGNLVRGAELRPEHKYGLEAPVAWPHLWLVLPDQVRRDLADVRARLDVGVRALAWGALFAALAIAIRTSWALLVGAAAVVLAYFALLETAKVYSDLVDSAFDVYRAKVYLALRWPLPRDPADEVEQGLALTEYLWRGSRESWPEFTRPAAGGSGGSA
jgi:hypothetical protein